ncbi:peptidoglycan editing factor PgeF [Vibrio sp. SM6]|uniref:Purine nucleoside phosphorylase n=1 Tax=Vibrio agarilyticus TaxID=2726741 RepID=A0A7X8TNX3_9VIBR|nr:peptidoglycan editing factor PgeF [Vibrio agarilyticus]
MIHAHWPAPSQVKAISTTREGGFSHFPYEGWNLGLHVGDDATAVNTNRREIAARLGMPNPPTWLEQTHSTDVVKLIEPNRTFSASAIAADASWTATPGVVCAVMTADCLPIVLTNTQGNQVAAVHAGWRGLADGIVEKTAALMTGDIMAWIGPAIGPKAFEVGEDVRDAFCDVQPQAEQAFFAIAEPLLKTPKKYLADLPQLAAMRLRQVGVNQIYFSDCCTFADPERFYSYRRDGVTGRQATFIWIEPQF